MNRMTGRLTVTICVLMAIWVSGCGSAKTVPGPNVPLDTVNEECKTLEPPQLHERAVAYRDLIRNVLKEQDEMDQRIATAQSEFASEDTIAKLNADKEQLEKTHLALVDRYQIYYRTLVRAGVNIDDAKVEEQPEEPQPPEDIVLPPLKPRVH